MSRFLILLLLLSPILAPNSLDSAAQGVSDADMAAIVAVELSALEANGDFNTLYDRIHPDARVEIPRAAVIGWFQNEFYPRGPGVSTVTHVEFVSWTWAVTGQIYPYTAQVSFSQPFADGTVVEDVVRLVQDHNGEWRWFFGRSREFVDEQIVRYVPTAPQTQQQTTSIDSVFLDIDYYWAVSFAAAGREYVSPSVQWIERPYASSCGVIDPAYIPAAYCSFDQTIYLEPTFIMVVNDAIGDFAWITIVAHEFGHHVQAMDGGFAGPGNAKELQADCLAGSYALNAATLGYLEPGDLIEAVSISAQFGDPAWLPQDQAGAHGTSDDRVSAFMRGYLDGFVGCGFMRGGTQQVASASIQPAPSLDLTSLLPRATEVPSDLSLTSDRSRVLADVVVNYTNPTETDRLFRQWGWQGNVTRSYEGSGWQSGVSSIYVSIHQFGNARDAVDGMNYSFDDQITSTGAWEILAPSMADSTRAMATSYDTTLYAQQGNVIFRITVNAPGADSMQVAGSVLESMLTRTP